MSNHGKVVTLGSLDNLKENVESLAILVRSSDLFIILPITEFEALRMFLAAAEMLALFVDHGIENFVSSDTLSDMKIGLKKILIATSEMLGERPRLDLITRLQDLLEPFDDLLKEVE